MPDTNLMQGQSMAERADALEAAKARELDLIVIKSRLHMWADGDMGPRPTPACCCATGRAPAC